LNIPFTYSTLAMEYVCNRNNLDLLQWFWHNRSKMPFNYDMSAFNVSCSHLDMKIFRWWIDRHDIDGLELKYTSEAISYAFGNGNIDLLDYMLGRSDLEFKFDGIDNIIIDMETYRNGRSWTEDRMKDIISTVKWYFDHSDVLEIKYTELFFVNCATHGSDPRLLQFYFEKVREGFKFKYDLEFICRFHPNAMKVIRENADLFTTNEQENLIIASIGV
jgi:hypothetical protein